MLHLHSDITHLFCPLILEVLHDHYEQMAFAVPQYYSVATSSSNTSGGRVGFLMSVLSLRVSIAVLTLFCSVVSEFLLLEIRSLCW